jgi:hypothetical protein
MALQVLKSATEFAHSGGLFQGVRRISMVIFGTYFATRRLFPPWADHARAEALFTLELELCSADWVSLLRLTEPETNGVPKLKAADTFIALRAEWSSLLASDEADFVASS